MSMSSSRHDLFSRRWRADRARPRGPYRGRAPRVPVARAQRSHRRRGSIHGPAAITARGVVHLPGIIAVEGQRALLAAVEHYRAAGLEPVAQEYVEGPKLQAAVIRRGGTTTCRLVAHVERGTHAEATLCQLD